MAVKTLPGRPRAGTLSINPAFLQEIKDSNPDLWQTLDEVRQVCQSHDGRLEVSRRLVRCLDALRDHLALQFALEESYGYIDIPTAVAHAADSAVEDVRGQHCALYLEISELCERAEELQYRGLAAEQLEQLIGETRSFDARLRRHEKLESDLIQGAYFDQRRR